MRSHLRRRLHSNYQIAEGIDVTATYGEVKNSLDERWFTGFGDTIHLPARRALVFVVTLDLDEVCLAEAACRKIHAFSTPHGNCTMTIPAGPRMSFSSLSRRYEKK